MQRYLEIKNTQVCIDVITHNYGVNISICCFKINWWHHQIYLINLRLLELLCQLASSFVSLTRNARGCDDIARFGNIDEINDVGTSESNTHAPLTELHCRINNDISVVGGIDNAVSKL